MTPSRKPIHFCMHDSFALAQGPRNASLALTLELQPLLLLFVVKDLGGGGGAGCLDRCCLEWEMPLGWSYKVLMKV